MSQRRFDIIINNIIFTSCVHWDWLHIDSHGHIQQMLS